MIFSDLVGSTALSVRMTLRICERLSRPIRSASRRRWVARRFRREVHGRRVLIYFGYPHAHEDDAERAVRAGLDLRGARLVGRHQVEVNPQATNDMAQVVEIIGVGDKASGWERCPLSIDGRDLL